VCKYRSERFLRRRVCWRCAGVALQGASNEVELRVRHGFISADRTQSSLYAKHWSHSTVTNDTNSNNLPVQLTDPMLTLNWGCTSGSLLSDAVQSNPIRQWINCISNLGSVVHTLTEFQAIRWFVDWRHMHLLGASNNNVLKGDTTESLQHVLWQPGWINFLMKPAVPSSESFCSASGKL